MSRLSLSLVLLTALLLGYDIYIGAGESVASTPIPAPYQTGMASWYGAGEQGKLTADGEIYNRHALTAAHRHLPFNTRIMVTNRENGRSVEVRINDRGPYSKNRVLDLSEAAAKALDMKKSGVTPVEIEVIQRGSVKLPRAVPGSTLP